jgi:hypothetical protein
MNLPINNNLCLSIKSKNCKNIQCPHKRKLNEIYCGIHLKNNVEIYIPDIPDSIILENQNIVNIVIENDINIENSIIINNNNTANDDNTTNDDNIVISNAVSANAVSANAVSANAVSANAIIDNDKNIIYSKNDFFELFIFNKYEHISIFTLRNNIKKLNLTHIINTKQSKSILIKEIIKLIELERYYKNNYNKLIIIQSIIRKWSINRRKKSCNLDDIMSFDSIYDIPSKFYYLFYDPITKKSFGYDIRTLICILKSDYPSCPYTCRNFTDDEKDVIIKHSKKLLNAGISLDLEKIEMNPEQEMEMRMKDIFHNMNMLDNYTSHTWFKNLELNELINYYIILEDIWNYRINMDIESKKRILQTHNGIAFNLSISYVRSIKSKLSLQNILLNEINRFVTEGINRDEKKLGVMLILTGLVEVSYDAAMGLPHLIPF